MNPRLFTLSRQNYQWTRIGIGIIMILITLIYLGVSTRFVECRTESLKGVNFLLMLRSDELQIGDIVFIQGHPNPFIQGNFVKRVIGLPGDEVTRDGHTLRIKSHSEKGVGPSSSELPLSEYSPSKSSSSEISAVMTCLPMTTTTNQPLTPLSSQMIPEGYAFVAGDDPRSLDSRYQEFGLIRLETIWGRAIGSW